MKVLPLIYSMIQYRKRQKLCGIKVSRLIGFNHNVGKTFLVC